jgi:predicted RNase H-like HicB family nuclease
MDRIILEVVPLPEGVWLGTSRELPGLVVQADTPDEVIRLAPEIARDLLAVMRETGQPIELKPVNDRPFVVPVTSPRDVFRSRAETPRARVRAEAAGQGLARDLALPQTNQSASIPRHSGDLPKGTAPTPSVTSPSACARPAWRLGRITIPLPHYGFTRDRFTRR